MSALGDWAKTPGRYANDGIVPAGRPGPGLGLALPAELPGPVADRPRIGAARGAVLAGQAAGVAWLRSVPGQTRAT